MLLHIKRNGLIIIIPLLDKTKTYGITDADTVGPGSSTVSVLGIVFKQQTIGHATAAKYPQQRTLTPPAGCQRKTVPTQNVQTIKVVD